MVAPVRPGRDVQSCGRPVRDHQRAQLAAMSGLLWSGVADIEVVDIGCEAADSRRLLSIGVGLVRTRAEPARLPELARQVEPYADSRPGAVPPRRGHDLAKQGKPVRQPARKRGA